MKKRREADGFKNMSGRYSVIKIIFGIIIFAFVIRLIGLNKCFHGDELLCLSEARSLHNIPYVIMEDSHPPLYFYLLHFWMSISQNEAYLRLLSVIPGVGLCWLVYLIGKETFGRQVGIISSFVTALAPIAVWVSQYVRPYSIACFFTTLSVYFLIMLMKKEVANRLLWLGFVLASAAGIYTFYFSALLIIAENIFVSVFLRNDKAFVKIWVMSQMSIAALYVPWIPFFIYQKSSYFSQPQIIEKIGFYVGTMHLGGIIRSAAGLIGFDSKLFARAAVSTDIFLVNFFLILSIAILIICGVIAVRYFRFSKFTPQEKRFLWLLFLLAAVPFIISVFLHQTLKIHITNIYFVSSFVVLTLALVAVGVRTMPRKIQITFFVMLLILYVIRLTYIYQNNEMDFKSLRRYLETSIPKGSVLVSGPFSGFGASVDYYLSDRYKIYFLDNPKTWWLENKDMIFISYFKKLELKEYERHFKSFLARKDYHLRDSRKFGSLVIESYYRL